MEKAREAAKWATKMAEALPTEYKVVGFQEFLKYRLLGSTESENSAGKEVPATSKKPAPTVQTAVDWLDPLIADLPADHFIREKGSEEHKVGWAVLSLVYSGQVAVNRSIGDYIRMNLGVAPPSRQNINRALRKLVPKYLSREKSGEGKSLAYLPKPSINDLFADLKTDAT